MNSPCGVARLNARAFLSVSPRMVGDSVQHEIRWIVGISVPVLVGIGRLVWSVVKSRLSTHKTGRMIRRTRFWKWMMRGFAHFLQRRANQAWIRYWRVEPYITSLHRRHEWLVIPGQVELPIDRCYVPLELRAGQVAEGTQLLHRTGAVLLLGDPGSGKSALLSRMIRTLTSDYRREKEKARLPVYLSLESIARLVRASNPEELTPAKAMEVLEEFFWKEHAEPLNLYHSRGVVKTLAESRLNGIVLLLDGLDELDGQDLHNIEFFLIAITSYLQAAEGRNLVIIASRRQALDFMPRLSSGSTAASFITVDLKPFSPAAIYAFILRWPHHYPGKVAAAEASRIYSQIRINPTLMDTCSNPLALALYVNRDLRARAEDVAGSGRIELLQPETRAGFFEDIIEYLLVRRRADRTPGARAPGLPFKQVRRRYFIDVVKKHVESREIFNQISADLMSEFAGPLAREGQSVDEALSTLAKDTGVIARNDDGTWRFVHVSFLNYFLACSLAVMSSQTQRRQLFQRLQKNALRYEEGFYLACGLMAARSASHLEALLEELAKNAFVGKFYPRAVLEAQAYFVPSFIPTIRMRCSRIVGGEGDKEALRDLIAVLIDYQHACDDLGKQPEITVKNHLMPVLEGSGVSLLKVAALDIDSAMMISGEGLTNLLRGSATEDAIVALYSPAVVDQLSNEDLVADPRLAAVVAEAALRSSQIANWLVRRPDVLAGRAKFSSLEERWADAWPVRGTRYGVILSKALPYVRSADDRTRAEFPRLALMTFTRPIRRLRYELLIGDWRVSLLAAAAVTECIFALVVLGVSWPWVALGGMCICASVLLIGRVAALRGWLTLATPRILNLQPIKRGLGESLGHRARVVRTPGENLVRWSIREPRNRDGRTIAIYDRDFPRVWRRFCPGQGDTRLSRTGCAAMSNAWTEDVRELIRGQNA